MTKLMTWKVLGALAVIAFAGAALYAHEAHAQCMMIGGTIYCF